MTCYECGNPADHLHHVVPRSLGGNKTLPLCSKCHSMVHGRRLNSGYMTRLKNLKGSAQWLAPLFMDMLDQKSNAEVLERVFDRTGERHKLDWLLNQAARLVRIETDDLIEFLMPHIQEDEGLCRDLHNDWNKVKGRSLVQWLT